MQIYRFSSCEALECKHMEVHKNNFSAFVMRYHNQLSVNYALSLGYLIFLVKLCVVGPF